MHPNLKQGMSEKICNQLSTFWKTDKCYLEPKKKKKENKPTWELVEKKN